MKTFAVILALLASVLFMHADNGGTPIKNGHSQSDFDMGGNKLTNVVDILDPNGDSLLGGGGPSSDTAGNIGSGAAVFAQKSGSQFQFRAISNHVGSATISNNTTTVFIEADPVGAASSVQTFAAGYSNSQSIASGLAANRGTNTLVGTNGSTIFNPKVLGGSVSNLNQIAGKTAAGSYVLFRDDANSDSSNDRFVIGVDGDDGGCFQWWDGVQGQVLLYSFDNGNSLLLDGAGDVYINSSVTVAGRLMTGNSLGNGFKISGSGGGVTLGGGSYNGNGSGLTSLTAANISGVIPPANLGTGTSISGKFLRGDGTYQTIGGGGDMLAANNLSDVANVATARGNIGAAASATTITIAGTANQITSSAGAQDLSANRTATLSLPSTLVAPGTFAVTALQTSHGVALDQWLIQTNNTDHSLTFSNTLFGTTPLTILTNGTVLFGGVPLILGTALKASQFVSTDVNTNLISTQDGSGWTNLDTHFTNYGATTNIVLPADGNNWRVLATNGPHNFFSFGGNNMGAISIWITTNGDAALPPQVTYLGYSDIHTTNCIIDLQPWGGTNRVLAGKSEL